MSRLGVNIDHVATLRNARMVGYPSITEAALVVERSGADFITVHLREDRRHINDEDVFALIETVEEINLEIACTAEMCDIALKLRPKYVTFVPENRQELTTESGLDVIGDNIILSNAVARLQEAKIFVNLFLDPDVNQVVASSQIGVNGIEINTARYSLNPTNEEIDAIIKVSEVAYNYNLHVSAGHGLDASNISALVKCQCIQDFNIGFSIVANGLFVGLANSVANIKKLICCI